jgi:hypothetical protein
VRLPTKLQLFRGHHDQFLAARTEADTKSARFEGAFCDLADWMSLDPGSPGATTCSGALETSGSDGFLCSARGPCPQSRAGTAEA